MKIYILYETFYDDFAIFGVYDSWAKANRQMKNCHPTIKGNDKVSILEVKLNAKAGKTLL